MTTRQVTLQDPDARTIDAMNRIERGMVYLIPVLLVLAEALALALNPSIAPHHTLQPLNGQLHFTATAAAIALMTTRRAEIGHLCGLAGILAAVLLPACYAMGARDLVLLSIVFQSVWLASLLLAAYAALRTRGDARRSSLDLLAIRFSLPVCLPIMKVMLWFQSRQLDTVYDLHLHAFDGLFGIGVVKAIANFSREVPGVLAALTLVYQSLIPAVTLFVVLQRTEQGLVHGKLLSRFLIAAAIGYGIYVLIPGIGPARAFLDVFPHGLPEGTDIVPGLFVEYDAAPRNAMPSLHNAWALLVFIAAWPMGPWLRLLGGLFYIATLVSTVALGEHYLVDLIVAVPFVVLVEGVAANPFARAQRRESLQAIAGGAAMIATWLLAIRLGAVALRDVPLAPWLLTATTLGLSVLLLARLLGKPAASPAVAPDLRRGSTSTPQPATLVPAE